MSGHHGHSHGLGIVTATGKHRQRLLIVFLITISVVLIQVAGALFSGSLALLADAGHMLSDAAGVSIALVAAWLAARPATSRRTYGYQRAEVLAALANAVLLIVIAVVIFVEALGRLGGTPDVDTGLMLPFAIVGGLANLVSLLVLHAGRKDSLNVRGAYLEVLGDLLGSAAVVVSAVVIMTTGYQQADTWASILIAVMILPRAWSLLREVIDVLLEATPQGVDVGLIRDHIVSVDGVSDAHDIHIWTITSGVPVFSAHVVVEEEHLTPDGLDLVLDRLTRCLSSHFDTDHCTFQLEPASHAVHEGQQHA
ncbi:MULTISPECIES: cation diffusion facilitator family transporter [unclassified Arthrobacter]|uniref:cation diffusion facilitator family transporter n=1 Tax=unclassified Arthrobacter TaxID=235627 RepID=UPI001E2A37DE|nr:MULTISPECIES: cation diffusion facilitator family transporter [unclassified Arthrobacter]MCC9144119.1 cation diffusion facilitator family transporter [Arthrobacter sp. zg-Y919]MDK1275344.1 cation diffusion facilitator family transporter [Arthrobacter sp. zg.Y919]MDM7990976.1 cation diffusion facilitator family transporter [Arthrobacter sp. zg-Y877]WIB03267.1 cation diffusion facilitator family transporter [Arthrobacter sp. zg-Y919]